MINVCNASYIYDTKNIYSQINNYSIFLDLELRLNKLH